MNEKSPNWERRESDTEIRRRQKLKDAPRCVLFVEDCSFDFELACIELEKIDLQNKCLRVSTADEMLEYLRSMDAYLNVTQYPMPAVIVIDYGLPGADGLEAQAMLRSELKFRVVPIIATSSPDRIEILKSALALGADGYMTKPLKGEAFKQMAQRLQLALQFGGTETSPAVDGLAPKTEQSTAVTPAIG
jgi:CheY-like chemotaxis protein